MREKSYISKALRVEKGTVPAEENEARRVQLLDGLPSSRQVHRCVLASMANQGLIRKNTSKKEKNKKEKRKNHPIWSLDREKKNLHKLE